MTTWVPSGQNPSQREPRKVSESLDRIAKRLGGPSSGAASSVFSRWDELVGPDIAGHARPVSLHAGILVLAVDHPAWATQLRYMTADLLTRIGAVTAGAEVREIHLRVTGEPGPEAPFRRGRRKGS